MALVRALYTFKGAHNDELNFSKGALITLTQKEDGGWWEGTLNGKTGWFPANYVQEVQQQQHYPVGNGNNGADEAALAEEAFNGAASARQIEFRRQLVRDLLDKEREFVAELQQIQKKYLAPLHRAEIVSEMDFRYLVGNLDELVEIHRNLALALEDSARVAPREQRLGRTLLSHGAAVRAAHQTYWANHPKAVATLEKNRDRLDKFMEAQGSPSPGLMALTTALSKPFRHLEKYAGLAQEMEQHLEDDHIDRGDTQRSISFYKSVASDCARLRRQKELELEVLSSQIRNWEGDVPITALGEILHLGAVSLVVASEKKDRYLVLFPSYLLMLSVSARMSAFIYEGKLPLSGIAVTRLEDSDSLANAFEITGSLIDRITVICPTRTECLKWTEVLMHYVKASRQTSQTAFTPTHKPGVQSSPASQSKRPQNLGGPMGVTGKGYLWKMSCLRPAPPTRSYLAVDGRRTVKKKDPDTTYEEDMQILRVIEAYFTANKRHTQVQSAYIDNSPVLLAEEEKVLTEDSSTGATDDRISDTVYALRDQVVMLRQQNKDVVKLLEEEIVARKRLETFVRAHFGQQD